MIGILKPKQEAEYFLSFINDYLICFEDENLKKYSSKRIANICIDRIIETVSETSSNEIELDFNYWVKVKKELNKL